MPIDHSNIDSPLLGHPSQVILDCVKLCDEAHRWLLSP